MSLKYWLPFLWMYTKQLDFRMRGDWFSSVPKAAAHDLPVFPLLCSMTFKKSYFGCSSWALSNVFIWIHHKNIATWMHLHSYIKPARWQLLEVWDTLCCKGVRKKNNKNLKAIINKIMFRRGKFFLYLISKTLRRDLYWTQMLSKGLERSC